ncbi:hypothetical protein NHX12_004347, partial [Muraenolepis orangiensis]
DQDQTGRVRWGEHTAASGGVAATGFGGETGRRLNLTGSYGVLKLLSKENLVRIVNSQLQSFQSGKGGGGRGRKRDLIDVNSGHSEPGRRDLTVTQSHSGSDNQTALPRNELGGTGKQTATSRPDTPPSGRPGTVVAGGQAMETARPHHLSSGSRDAKPCHVLRLRPDPDTDRKFFVIEEYAGPEPVLIGR